MDTKKFDPLEQMIEIYHGSLICFCVTTKLDHPENAGQIESPGIKSNHEANLAKGYSRFIRQISRRTGRYYSPAFGNRFPPKILPKDFYRHFYFHTGIYVRFR